MHNACVAVASMSRALQLARDYATKRVAFGKPISEQPLHVETLASMEVELAAGVQLIFRVAELLGKEETGQASEAESTILRLLTPLAKLYTGKQVVAVTSEALECFGGAGYMEDTGIPRLLRDAQTLAIWEGTTNVLSLDALRAIEKEGAFAPFMADARDRLDRCRLPELAEGVRRAQDALGKVEAYLSMASREGLDFAQAGGRQFAYSLTRTYVSALLAEQAVWSVREGGDSERRYALETARRWFAQELAPLAYPHAAHQKASSFLGSGEA